MDRIGLLELEIAELRAKLHEKEAELIILKKEAEYELDDDSDEASTSKLLRDDREVIQLPKWAIKRYSRQILLSEIGVLGQAKLCLSKVLVVGVGGLGCPAAMYLAGAGVGQIGLVDYDTVDITNLHRQILHHERDESFSKVESAARKLKSINSRIKVVTYNVQMDSCNANEIVAGYNVVLDCTDNVPSRYLLNDLCVFSKIPLISGSALKMEGQLTMYGYRSEEVPGKKHSYTGPCYRCVFPRPPPPAAVGSCSADGVAGPVPGVIGTLQALEAIKYLADISVEKLLVGRMLLFDGEDMTIKITKLRSRTAKCPVCSDNPTITGLVDYETFCRIMATGKDQEIELLADERRITAGFLRRMMYDPPGGPCVGPPLLFDVRSEGEFRMCHIDGSINTPKDKFGDLQMEKFLELIRKCESDIVFICRRGNDSQIVVQKLLDAVEVEHHDKLYDVIGGLHAWSKEVDRKFPAY